MPIITVAPTVRVGITFEPKQELDGRYSHAANIKFDLPEGYPPADIIKMVEQICEYMRKTNYQLLKRQSQTLVLPKLS